MASPSEKSRLDAYRCVSVVSSLASLSSLLPGRDHPEVAAGLSSVASLVCAELPRVVGRMDLPQVARLLGAIGTLLDYLSQSQPSPPQSSQSSQSQPLAGSQLLTPPFIEQSGVGALIARVLRDMARFSATELRDALWGTWHVKQLFFVKSLPDPSFVKSLPDSGGMHGGGWGGGGGGGIQGDGGGHRGNRRESMGGSGSGKGGGCGSERELGAKEAWTGLLALAGQVAHREYGGSMGDCAALMKVVLHAAKWRAGHAGGGFVDQRVWDGRNPETRASHGSNDGGNGSNDERRAREALVAGMERLAQVASLPLDYPRGRFLVP